MMPGDNTIIQVNNLSRHFTVADGKSGFLGSIQNLFSRRYTTKKAVDDISFSIAKGDFVGYVGENGAGKSTTIKMLTGILVPTSGEIVVAGNVPHKNRAQNARNIGVVFGQRTQLWWDLPVLESFDLLRSIFRVPENDFKRNFEELSETLELGPLLKVPVRKLSLGQRMRCDLTAALLHSPRILFLDEPTIGLDIIAKDYVRKFLKKINKERETTIILTTHDMDDIEALCSRIIILDQGKIAYDGSTEKLKADYVREKAIEVELHEDDTGTINIPNVELVKSTANKKWLRFNQDDISVQEVISQIMQERRVKDIAIHEPKVGDIIKNIYANGKAASQQAKLQKTLP
ncbi:Efflux ABC transporter, ATP-binding protein [hydrothermal vent metagenome]|uniref:Efflux ABC transporter, ATP-binding protein n=1 Tax=hydrothermal vent metagenome TaxID=652676 RepID=A0A3B1BGC0_9ZZZZ